MYVALEFIIKGIGYSFIIYAFWLMFGQSFYANYIKSTFRDYLNKKRIKRLQELESKSSVKKEPSPLIKHLELVLGSVSKKTEVNVKNFIVLSTILFFVTLVLLLSLFKEPTFSLLVAILLGSTPYLIVLYQLESIRLKTSLVFMNEYHIILQNYQSTNRNIYYTLLNIVEDLQDKRMKRQFRKLISSIQKERSDEAFRKNVYLFIFSINSTFAKRFGNLLLKAHLEDANIGDPLLDLNRDITKRKEDMENEVTNKMETIMIGFSPIIVLPLILYFAYRLTGVIDFWHYFMVNTSLYLFAISVILSITCVALAMLIKKPKSDI